VTDFPDGVSWQLPVAGFAVEKITFYGGVLMLYAYGPDRKHFDVTLSGPFRLDGEDGGAESLDPETNTWEELAGVLALRNDQIAVATVSPDSLLSVDFVSGRRMTVAPDGSRYESWEVLGPGFKIVGVPEGPALWTGSAWNQS
jgi:hypothetical protein